jgi:hypothetical protein
MAGRAEDMDVAVAHFQGEEHAEYGDLVAQDEELDGLGRRCAAEPCQPAQ